MAVERADAVGGQTVILRITFRNAGALVDPDEVRQVEILDEDFSVLATISGTSIVHDSTGHYHVEWAIPANRPSQMHHDRWFATLRPTGCDETQFTLSFFVLPSPAITASATYLSVDEARAYLGDSQMSDSELAALITRCQAAIERICGQRFLPVSEVRTFDGPGRPVLNVRHPIQSVTGISIVCNGGSFEAMGITDIRISGSKTMLACGNVVPLPFRSRWWGLSSRFSHSAGCCCSSCCYFPLGFQNIRVEGSWGAWPAVPEEIKHALGLLIQHAAACDDPLGAHAHAFSDEATDGDRAYTIREIWRNVIQDARTGFSEVDSILARYLAPPVVIGVP